MKWLSLLLIIVACQKSPSLHHFSGTAFQIPYHIQIGHFLSRDDEEAVVGVIEKLFTHIDRTFNHWNAQSEVSSLNGWPINQPFAASEDLIDLLHMCQSIHELTEGRFDPTIGALTTNLKEGQDLESVCGFEHVKIQGLLVTKTAPVKFDFDGIVKGYAIDRLIDCLSEYDNVYVEWGGEISVMGYHPQKRPWKILVGKTTIDLTEGALATSSDALQQFGDVTHIIDPKTGAALPIRNRCVSIKAPSCALADALATACMIEDLSDRINQLPATEVIQP